MSDLLILNAILVNEYEIFPADVYIKNGRIETIASGLSHLSASQIIDASGKYLIPGMIDDQVHFREPGLTHKGDIATESKAAIAGGITSYMEMPNCKPTTTTIAALEDKYALAAQKSLANHAFYLGASNDNLEVIKAVDPKLACGVKVFMGASTGNMLVDDPEILEQIFQHSPILIATHCENTPMIQANEIAWQKKYGDALTAEQHPYIRSAEACYASSSFAVDLAKRYHSKLHVLHLTTARELELFTAGAIDKKQITAEVCVHHLSYNEADYKDLGNLMKCNPAIKTLADQQALQQALINDVIDIIATDHAPHTLEEKQRPYPQAPAGLPLVQHALLSLFEHYQTGWLSLEQLVHKTSHAPAMRFDVKERGYLREGYWADLVLVDLQQPYTVTAENILYKCGWSTFTGRTFPATIDSTIVNGRLVYQQGHFLNTPPGQRLEFIR